MKRGRWRILKRLGIGMLVLVGLLLVAGKLAGFSFVSTQRPLDAAASLPTQNDLLEGSWTGTWASSECDMGGELRCQIQKLPSSDYQARFDAVVAKVFSNESNVTLHVESNARPLKFSGQEDLGIFRGGVYAYHGHCDGREFVCEYDSKLDKGTFRLKRAVPTTAATAK